MALSTRTPGGARLADLPRGARLADLARLEVPLQDYVPYSAHIAPDVIRTREGAYLSAWRVAGVPFETRDATEIEQLHEAWNAVVASLPGGQCALWVHQVRHRMHDALSLDYDNAFAGELAARYHEHLNAQALMVTEQYLTLMWWPASASRGLLGAVFQPTPTVEQRVQAQAGAVRVIRELGRQLGASLERYQPRALGCLDADGAPLDDNAMGDPTLAPVRSELAEFFALLLNAERTPVPLAAGPLYQSLPTSKIFCAGDRLEIRTPTATRYVAILDIQDYPDHSEPGMLNALLYEPWEYIATHSFAPMTARQAQSALKLQQRQLIAAGDVAGSQIEAMTEAADRLANGDFAMGEYHYSMAVLAHTPDELDQALAGLRSAFSAEVRTALVDLVPDAAWFAQLPGNARWRTRMATLTSRNFCALAPLHAFPAGKREGNPWGEPVAILKSPSGAPVYCSFHATRLHEDATGARAPGHTKIIGATGQGKTVVEMALLALVQRFGVSAVCYDRDRGMEIAVRALGGTYSLFRHGQPTGMNPLQMAPSEEAIQYWHGLCTMLLGAALSHAEQQALDQALRTVATFPPALRRLTALAQNLPDGANGLRQRLQQWCAGARLGWVFDNPEDTIRFDRGTLFGFDDSALVRDAEVAGPVTNYLLHCTRSLMDGRRFMYVIAEGWERLADPVMQDFLVAADKTARKLNAFGVFDTQSPSDMLRSPFARTLIEQTATEIYLPNPRADRAEYCDGFKLSQAEFELVRSFPDGSRLMLLKQGHQSAVCTLDLAGMPDLVDILSANETSVRLLDEIRAQVGDEPAQWLPLLRQRLQHERTYARRA